MKVRKYRPIKLWIILALCTIVGVLTLFLMDEVIKRIIAIISTILVFIGLLLTMTFYVAFQEDKIIIVNGHSTSALGRLNLKIRRIIPVNLIKSISVQQHSSKVSIVLTDGMTLYYDFAGYFASKEILDNFLCIKGDISIGNNLI